MALMSGREIQRRLERAAHRAAEEAARDVKAMAQREVPVDSGALRDSAEAEARRVPGAFQAVVSFTAPYAKKIHEAQQYKHTGGGKAHFLSDPIKAYAPRFRQKLIDAYRRALR